jgi:hypothetical protein
MVVSPPRAPGFTSDSEWEQFKHQVERARSNGMIPAGVKTAEQALAIALKGRELGMQPMYALSQLYVVHGKVGMQAEAMRAKVFEMYPTARIEYITPPEKRHREASFRFVRPGGGEQIFTFDIEDAFHAGLVRKDKNGRDGYSAAAGKAPWDTARPDMLMARCTSKGVRIVFPECVMGCSLTPEELESIDVTPTQTSTQDLEARFQKKASPQAASEPPKAEALPPAAAVTTIPAAPTEEPDMRAGVLNHDEQGPEAAVTSQGQIVTAEPEVLEAADLPPGDYLVKCGRYIGKRLHQVDLKEWRAYLSTQAKPALAQRPEDTALAELIKAIEKYIAAGV